MKIVNRDVNFDGTCQKVNSNSKICDMSRDEEKFIMSSFEELRSSGKEEYDDKELKNASEVVRNRDLAKKKVLKKEENGGFILISGLTVVGTLVVGAIIFMAIKLLVIG